MKEVDESYQRKSENSKESGRKERNTTSGRHLHGTKVKMKSKLKNTFIPNHIIFF